MTTTEPVQRPSRWRRLRRDLWLAAGFVVLAAGLLYIQRQHNAAPGHLSAPSLYGKPFTLTGRDGRAFSSEALRGKPYTIYFGFTRCPDVCPTTLGRLASLRARLGKQGDRFNIVFVSVDPAHDTPEDIGRYVDMFGTPIIGLTGTEAQIADVTRSYGVFVRKVPMDGGDYTIDHTASVFLMGSRGELVSTISHQEAADVALRKLENLVR